MNIFNQYGIKEVADVVFYSITRIGDEEFYTPVLYFDTLKVSSIEMNGNNVSAYGGKGNGKILSWGYNKDITLKLEDALFSQQSLDLFMNGRVAAKLSSWAAALAKVTVANKYGQKHYSTKAFPSPELTDEEWEIVYRCAQKAGYDPRTGETYSAGTNSANPNRVNHSTKYVYDTLSRDTNIDGMVAENRWLLKRGYKNRMQKTERPHDIASFFDINRNKYESVSLILATAIDDDQDALVEEYGQAIKINNLKMDEQVEQFRKMTLLYREKKTGEDFETKKLVHYTSVPLQLRFSVKKTIEGFKCTEASFAGYGELLQDIFPGFNVNQGVTTPTIQTGNEFFLNHILYFLFPNYLEVILDDLCWCDLNGITQKAMPAQIIHEIENEFSSYKSLGYTQNDLSEAQTIDRFEKEVVIDENGLKIDLIQQLHDIKEMIKDNKNEYQVFYDAKTLRPFAEDLTFNESDYEQKAVRIMKNGELLEKDIYEAIKKYLQNVHGESFVYDFSADSYYVNEIVKVVPNTSLLNQWVVYFSLVRNKEIILKPGTVYYRRSRTINYDTNELTYLGINLTIDDETFSDEYLVVGETIIRDQKTFKDQHCQFVINRAKVSADTKVDLQAGGEPTTFSIKIDALTPNKKGKGRFELKTYKTESVECGSKIIAQDKRHVRTKLMQKREEIIINNNEIY